MHFNAYPIITLDYSLLSMIKTSLEKISLSLTISEFRECIHFEPWASTILIPIFQIVSTITTIHLYFHPQLTWSRKDEMKKHSYEIKRRKKKVARMARVDRILIEKLLL